MRATFAKSNFSASELYDVYSKLEKIFGEGNVLFIGGRAVNLLCEKNQRPTHDIDVAVLVPEDKIMGIRRKAIDEGFVILKEKGGMVTSIETVTPGNKPMQIDLYYDRPISGISIPDLFKKSKKIEKSQGKETYSFKVANPGHLLVLKYFAYNEADKNNKEKHLDDIKSLLNTYGGIDNFFSKFGNVIKKLFSEEKYKLFQETIKNIIVFSEMLRY